MTFFNSLLTGSRMAKLSSLEDLNSLLSDSDRKSIEVEKITPSPVQKGYNGKPQKLDVKLDSKKRRGKTVTVISGFQSNPSELERIAQLLKKSCGAGGTVLDNTIEIQGVHRAKAIEMLLGMGYLVKG